MKILKLLVLMSLLMLCGCGRQNTDGKVTTSTSSSSNTPITSNMNTTFNGVDDLLTYFNNNGMMSSDIAEIKDLEEGYLEGRNFTNNGTNYSMYKYDRANTSMNESVTNAIESKTLRMKINGEYTDVKVYVYGDYILVYDEDTNIDDFHKIFEGIGK